MFASQNDLAVGQELLCRGFQTQSPSALSFTNIVAESPEFGTHMVRDVYPGKSISWDSLKLILLPPDLTVFGDGQMYAQTQGSWLLEFIPTHLHRRLVDVNLPQKGIHFAEVIEEETLVIARYGIHTWGHWIIELLPKILLCEGIFPGRLKYALPQLGVTFQQSLAYYGISDDRVVWMRNDRDYTFHRCYSISPMWQSSGPHPLAIEMLRRRLDYEMCGSKKTALIRSQPSARTPVNSDELNECLRRHGFEIEFIARLSFREQVNVFQKASVVVSVLGSSLTGLAFSTFGVGVVTLAPARFGDNFFYGLAQNRSGRFADVRGRVVKVHEKFPDRDDDFFIDTAVLEKALESVS